MRVTQPYIECVDNRLSIRVASASRETLRAASCNAPQARAITTAHRDVVETISAVVNGESFTEVHIKREQIPDRIAVFIPIETVRRRTARIRM